jgi:hypothetical protein
MYFYAPVVKSIMVYFVGALVKPTRAQAISWRLKVGCHGRMMPPTPSDMVSRMYTYVTLALTGFSPIAQLSYTRGFEWTMYFYAPVVKRLGATVE